MSAPDTIVCESCGAATPAFGQFCIHCGAATQRTCAACGEAVIPGARFCLHCGAPVATSPVAEGDETDAGRPSAEGPGQPVSERRLVSVLFADLVGFTTLSEHRDPDEVRELLSQYFDRCRAVIERYGGTVEKFIGDAVMAVWGSPVAREDDPERAVRAALALTQAVSAMGDEVGLPELRLRAGVLTGNAAVNIGAEGEGMVLGDTVNTASRLQSIAAPGSVLVDDATRRASEAAIAYEDAGHHQVKGREQPVHAFTALRVVAGAGGARRSAGVEAPFVGRERELQTVIDAADASAAERRARHVSVIGDAGSGKSRLIWEFFKYLDGMEELRFWHQGRCLAYGEGVAYWALAEMIRSRARILEEDDPITAREKLRATVLERVPDERERRLVEPRLAHLLRLEERPDADRVDLFSGWRLFFERLATTDPVILVFEDLQWANDALLDFIDYLLEWSAEFPIFVLTIARPELRERRPAWQPLTLGPLEPKAIGSLLEALVPGLPDELVGEIVARSEGIPLYAVETVRMLQDRNVLVQEGDRYVVAGDVSDLAVPETLHALVASRLDGLSGAERGLLQDASVLGQSFTAAAAAALSGLAEDDANRLLDGLVRKQLLARDDDPRSPDRGQYVFLQALLRTVAYGTLSLKARKTRHLAAARHLEEAWPGEARDIAEVLAAHLTEAIAADPTAEDVVALRASARERLTAAGQAAASLALGAEADRYFDQAAELADDDLERGRLLELAGRALFRAGEADAAERRLRAAIELLEHHGRAAAVQATVTLSQVLRLQGRMDEARALLESFVAAVADDASVEQVVRAEALGELATTLVFTGRVRESGPLFDDALRTLEEEQAWASLAHVLVGRALYLLLSHRLIEGTGVLRQALALADEQDLPAIALRARYNLVQVLIERDQCAEAIAAAEESLAVARERGDRTWERMLVMQPMGPLVTLGRWDEALSAATPILDREVSFESASVAGFVASVAAARDDDGTLARCQDLAERALDFDTSYVDQRTTATLVLARVAQERQDPAAALQLLRPVLDQEGLSGDPMREALHLAVEAALQRDEAAMEDLVAVVNGLPPAKVTPLVRADHARLTAELAHCRSDDPAARHAEDEAIELLRGVGARPLLAQVLVERARRREDPEALAEARRIYEELGAVRRLKQLPAHPTPVV